MKYTTGQWHLGRDRDASSPASETSQLRSGKLCYHIWTPNSVPVATILLVHGLGEHANRYAPVAETLVQRGFEVIGYDQNGHGLTGGPLPDFETLLRDLEWVAHKLHLEHIPLIPSRKIFHPAQLTRIPEAQNLYSSDPLIHQRVSAILGLSMLKAGKWISEHAEQ